jgi:hypothetical protein
MVVRNDRLDPVAGVNATFNTKALSADWNDTMNKIADLFEESAELTKASIIQSSENLVRNLQVQDSPEGVNEFADAYVLDTGRKTSVTLANTTAFYNSIDKTYHPTVVNTSNSDTIVSAGSSGTWSDLTLGVDSDGETFANCTRTLGSGSSSNWDPTYGTTFTAKTITNVYVKAQLSGNDNSTRNFALYFQTYNGSTWTTVDTMYFVNSSAVNVLVSKVIKLNQEVQGVRLLFDSYVYATTRECRVYMLNYGTTTEQVVIEHDIEGYITSNTNLLFLGVPLLEDSSKTYTIDYKVTNDTQDTGWLSYNTRYTSTVLTNIPKKLIIRLNQADSYGIAGFVVNRI